MNVCNMYQLSIHSSVLRKDVSNRNSVIRGLNTSILALCTTNETIGKLGKIVMKASGGF